MCLLFGFSNVDLVNFLKLFICIRKIIQYIFRFLKMYYLKKIKEKRDIYFRIYCASILESQSDSSVFFPGLVLIASWLDDTCCAGVIIGADMGCACC